MYQTFKKDSNFYRDVYLWVHSKQENNRVIFDGKILIKMNLDPSLNAIDLETVKNNSFNEIMIAFWQKQSENRNNKPKMFAVFKLLGNRSQNNWFFYLYYWLSRVRDIL